MALSQEDINESEIAKNYVMNSDLDEDYKANLVDLINTSLIATNGISPEEKIQKMTNSIQKLAVSQVGLIKSIRTIIEDQMAKMGESLDKKISDAISESKKTQCDGCKAMKHANDVEAEQERKKIIQDFMRTSGIKINDGVVEVTDTVIGEREDQQPITKSGLINRVFGLLEKPYIWVFGCVVVFSPYGIEILKLIAQYFGNGGK